MTEPDFVTQAGHNFAVRHARLGRLHDAPEHVVVFVVRGSRECIECFPDLSLAAILFEILE